MTVVHVPGMWLFYTCRSCAATGEHRFDSLPDLQLRLARGRILCTRCGSNRLDVSVPGPFPQHVVDEMKKAADEGAIVTGMDPEAS